MTWECPVKTASWRRTITREAEDIGPVDLEALLSTVDDPDIEELDLNNPWDPDLDSGDDPE
jgi:hypothetical protein